MKFIMTGAPWYGPPLFAVIFPKVREAMMQSMNVKFGNGQRRRTPPGRGTRQVGRCAERPQISRWRAVLACRFDCLRPAVADGAAFSDKEASESFPEALLKLRNQHKGRRYFGWVRNVYGNYRQPMPMETRVVP
jgi:hypothetical protein